MGAAWPGGFQGSVGKRRRPGPINRHASTKAAGFWGPRRSALDPLALPRSQAQARLGPGGYCRCSGNGGSQTCLTAARGVAHLAGRMAHLHQQGTQDPREGPSLARRATPRPPRGAASPGWLPRSEDIKARQTSRGSRDVSHHNRHQAGARRAPARAASLFPLWC